MQFKSGQNASLDNTDAEVHAHMDAVANVNASVYAAIVPLLLPHFASECPVEKLSASAPQIFSMF